MSSLTRAFTKRSKRSEVSAPMPFREGQIKFSSGTIKRGNISGPVQLLSTTNMLAYDAPDLKTAGITSSSTVSLQSADGSDASASPSTVVTPLTSPDGSSHEASPIDMEPNHLSDYFPKRSATVTSHPRSSTSSTSTDSAPLVPQRALSHTKRSHQELARQRSLSRLSGSQLNAVRTNTASIRSTQELFQATSAAHPFGKELEQVNEVAEEFGATHLLDEEGLLLQRKGLCKFTAADYQFEIEHLYGSIFDDELSTVSTPLWV